MAFNGEKTAFVGAGVMGEAMIKGLLKERLLAPENIVAADPRERAFGRSARTLRH